MTTGREKKKEPTWVRTMQREAAESWENIEERAIDRRKWKEFERFFASHGVGGGNR